MANDPVKDAENFMKSSFIERPHHSFNDWKIIYNHSMTVFKFAVEISTEINCDKILLSVGAILHDIGKTYLADDETLHQKHEILGYLVSKEFIERIELTKDQKEELKKMLSNTSDSIEWKIIKDADAISFFADQILQDAFKEWADKRGTPDKIYIKLEKFNKLKFEISKKIAKPYYEKLAKKWIK